MAFAQQLDPALLQQLLAGTAGGGWTSTSGQNGWTGGESGGASGPMQTNFYDISSDPNTYGVYDAAGTLQDTRSKESSSAQLGRFLAGAAAMYGAGSLINGGMLGFGGGAGAAPGVAYSPGAVQSSITGLTDTLGGIAPASSSMIPAASFNVAPAVGAAAASGAAGAAGAAGASAPGASSGLAKALSGAGSLGNVIGAALGAASSRDQEQSANQTSTSKTTKDPYAPAKPFIDQMIGQGQQLATQYQQQPFSQAQQTAYNNFGGLLNAINGGVGGLTQGMVAASSGANNYDRSNPRKALQGGGINLSGWAPGLLQFFGAKG